MDFCSLYISVLNWMPHHCNLFPCQNKEDKDRYCIYNSINTICYLLINKVFLYFIYCRFIFSEDSSPDNTADNKVGLPTSLLITEPIFQP